MSNSSVSGSPMTAGGGRPSKAFRIGRVCAEEDCGTQLSIYNKGNYCYSHEPMAVPRTRGRKIA